VAAIGRPELGGDPRFKHHRARAANRREINGLLAAWARPRSSAEVLAALGPGGADVPCARVSSPEELIDDPQLLARGMIERHPHPTLGEVAFHGNALRFSGAEPRARALAPALGEANDEIYGALGIGADERRALAEKGVI
jgi:crotonobetainyl-CoA:carnitine CoA-transferase CaiB-like acyl-CoA transferase